MKTFVKLSQDCLSYQVFKNPVQVNGIIRFVNSEKTKNELGYYELDQSYPVTDEDHYAVRTAWEYSKELNKVIGVFEIKEREKLPRTFSKYKIMTYLLEKNMWQNVKSWIQSSGYSDFWDVPLDFNESDTHFKAGITAFCNQFEVTPEQLETMLSACVKDSYTV